MSQEYDESVDLVQEDVVRNLSAAVLFAALTGVLAQVSIPLPFGVPFSLQPFAVFFAALLLGPLWGGFSMVLYVVVGIAGVPVFSNFSAGLGHVAGPTGGFLIGFIIAAVIAGAIAHQTLQPNPASELSSPMSAVALGVAIAIIYAVGFPWFLFISGFELSRAVELMAPLFALDFLKAAIVVGIVTGDNELFDRL